jgi:hypothetical protein
MRFMAVYARSQKTFGVHYRRNSFMTNSLCQYSLECGYADYASRRRMQLAVARSGLMYRCADFADYLATSAKKGRFR